eukprot:2574253-Pyramimonas_sp.AAC.1
MSQVAICIQICRLILSRRLGRQIGSRRRRACLGPRERAKDKPVDLKRLFNNTRHPSAIRRYGGGRLP